MPTRYNRPNGIEIYTKIERSLYFLTAIKPTIEAAIAAANIKYIAVPSNGLFNGLGYSMLFPVIFDIIPPPTANTANTINMPVDHFPGRVLGKNDVFI